MVQTVLGEITPEQMGYTLVHEHLFHDVYEVTMNSNLIFSDYKVARSELELYKESGGVTLVDQTSHGINPQPEVLRSLSQETGVHVVAGTGFYWEKFHPAWVADMSQKELTELLVTDLTTGMCGTDVIAGIIGEIGTNHRAISPAEEKTFRACAAAQREVPVPISTHALFTRIGMAQLELLEDAGADLDHTVIGHVDTTPDVDYHEELLRRGVWIAYDAIGQLDKQTDEARAEGIAELIRRGWLDRLLLSTDVGKRPALAAYGGNGLPHVKNFFLPLLRDAGVTEGQINQIMVTNPARLFTF